MLDADHRQQYQRDQGKHHRQFPAGVLVAEPPGRMPPDHTPGAAPEPSAAHVQARQARRHEIRHEANLLDLAALPQALLAGPLQADRAHCLQVVAQRDRNDGHTLAGDRELAVFTADHGGSGEFRVGHLVVLVDRLLHHLLESQRLLGIGRDPTAVTGGLQLDVLPLHPRQRHPGSPHRSRQFIADAQGRLLELTGIPESQAQVEHLGDGEQSLLAAPSLPSRLVGFGEGAHLPAHHAGLVVILQDRPLHHRPDHR